MTEIKPLNWTPKPGVGLSVVRRGDGGMTLTFTDLSDATIDDWREFALEHLLGLSGRTRNFGFVVLNDRKDTSRVIGLLHQSELDGSRIVVNVATERR